MSVLAPKGRTNDTVIDAQAWTRIFGAAPKQPGRRYGPPPKNPPSALVMVSAPMTLGDRERLYHPMTDRQYRQAVRMAERNDEILRIRPGAKNFPTPKRPRRRAVTSDAH